MDCRLDDVRNLDDFVEKNIYRLTGSFLFILSALGSRRIYLDADGTLSVVYDQEARVAGATASVLLDTDEYQRRFRAELYKTLDVEDAGWFTAGLTAHEGITRLLCNHYLDLDNWTTRRHWPVAPIEISKDPASVCARICDRISQTTQILARAGSTSVALTAGNDSRLLLACSRQLLANLTFVTVAAPTADMDVACAKRLARQFGLRHDVLPYREATVAEADLWRFRAGHCVGGNNVKMHPSVEPLEGQYFIGGLGGEVGRGFLWLNAKQDTAIDAKGLVARLKLARTAEVVEAVDAWLAPLAHFDTFLILDLAYLELRMSTWGFCDSYVKPRHHEIHPIISRANYVDMLSLPPELRRKGDIYFQAIEARWKEISKVPINKYGNYKDILRPAKEAIRNPKRASRKVMQIVGAWR
ncbi:hypothetical protein ASC90_09245 [Rhizobium sp. Root1220]|nr:hypothetical protein ASC90_09245 [Rhizobium sp. Root1220]